MTDKTHIQNFGASASLHRADAKSHGGRQTMRMDTTNVSQQFEGVFLKQVIESMLPKSKSDIFGGGSAGDIWRSMFADSISGSLAKSNPLGLESVLNLSNVRRGADNVA